MAGREDLVVLNLPLRRRCLFLSDMSFLAHCFASEAGLHLLDTLHKIIVAHRTRLAVDGSLLSEGGRTEVDAAIGTLESITSSHCCRATDGLQLSADARLSWAEQLETLLSSLEVDSHACSPSRIHEDEVVRLLCIALVNTLYEKGVEYYAQKEMAEMKQEPRKRRRSRSGSAASSQQPKSDVSVKAEIDDYPLAPRVTWSIAHPVLETVYNIFN